MMSNALIAVVTLLYICVTIAAISEGSYGKAIVFAGYALANLGFILFD